MQFHDYGVRQRRSKCSALWVVPLVLQMSPWLGPITKTHKYTTGPHERSFPFCIVHPRWQSSCLHIRNPQIIQRKATKIIFNQVKSCFSFEYCQDVVITFLIINLLLCALYLISLDVFIHFLTRYNILQRDHVIYFFLYSFVISRLLGTQRFSGQRGVLSELPSHKVRNGTQKPLLGRAKLKHIC